mgnify:CR=1 FL=1
MKNEPLIRCEERGYEVPLTDVVAVTFGDDPPSVVCGYVLSLIEKSMICLHSCDSTAKDRCGGLDFYEFQGFDEDREVVTRGDFLFSVGFDVVFHCLPLMSARYLKPRTTKKI